MSFPLASHRLLNLIVLTFLLISSVFFSFYDILSEKIWWSTWFIYLPCSIVFLFGVYSWKNLNAGSLLILGIILLLIDAFLLGYGLWLWTQGELLWGPLTLGFSLLTGGLTYSTFFVWNKIKAE